MTRNRQLYHFELGFPSSAQMHFGQMLLEYSTHARTAAQNDRYGDISLPLSLDTHQATVIEIEMFGNKTTKVLYRVPYNAQHDLMIALIPDRRYVKTVWLNRKDDAHKTLEEWRYDIPVA